MIDENIYLRRMSNSEKTSIIQAVKSWVRRMLNRVEFGLVYDFGCGKIDYKEVLQSDKYIRIDSRPISDDIVMANLEEEVNLKEKADLIICNSLLEHVWNVAMVIDNIYNNLKNGGKSVVVTPYIYEYHGIGNVMDYWRFTPQCLNRLFGKFTVLDMEFIGVHREMIGTRLEK